MSTPNKRVLDVTCGSRMMWKDRANPDVVFGHIRRESFVVTDRSHGREHGTRALSVDPDIDLDFRDLPYASGQFSLVVFDPPHLSRAGKRSWMAAKYGVLSGDWRDDLNLGFRECFRVLKADGVLVFKWNEAQISVSQVVALSPYPPLFGHVTGRQGKTHWLTFMKPEVS